MGLEVRVLLPTPETLAAVQRVAESNPDYYRAVEGDVAGPTAAVDYFDCTDLPPAAKHLTPYKLGVYEGETLVGVADVLRGYRTPDCAWLGWWIVDAARHGQGLGRRGYAAVEKYIRTWPEITHIMLSVVEPNAPALTFWPHMGFRDTGERRPYREKRGEVTLWVFNKNLLNLELCPGKSHS